MVVTISIVLIWEKQRLETKYVALYQMRSLTEFSIQMRREKIKFYIYPVNSTPTKIGVI